MSYESYSSLKSFETCPHKWAQVSFYKNYPFKQGDRVAAEAGVDVHKLIADSISSGTPMPQDYAHVDKFVAPIRDSGYVLLPEYQMAVDHKMDGVPYDSPARLFRGDVDLLAITGNRAVVVDWKNGSSKYPDKQQLDAGAMLVFGNFPEVETITGMILFLQDGKMVDKSFNRSQAPFLWKQWVDRIHGKERAIKSKSFAKVPSGLCRGWCPVAECEHYAPPK